MDSIIGTQTLAFFQAALHKFKTEINSVYTNEIKQFITNRQALTDEELESEYIDRGSKLKLPAWIINFGQLRTNNTSPLHRTKRHAQTNYLPTTDVVKAGKQHRLLQLDINDIIFATLKNLNEHERVKNGKDCRFDQGGYFIINGSEKVIVAQERMGNN